MEVILSGEMYDEEVNIKYDNVTIYDGYLWDLLADDESSNIMLSLNYNDKRNQSNVIPRYLGKDILWIPDTGCCFEKDYKYMPMILSVCEFKELWESMKWDFERVINRIKKVTSEEILLTWYITSNIREDDRIVKDIVDYICALKHRFICTDVLDENIDQQILKLFDYKDYKKIPNSINLDNVREDDSNMIDANIYLDDNIKWNKEWNAIKIDSVGNVYLNLANKRYIPILK